MTTSPHLLMMAARFETRLAVLAAALALDALFGDLPQLTSRLPRPSALAGRGIALFERRLNRATRSAAVRRARGALVAVVAVGTGALAGFLLGALAQRLPRGLGGLVELMIVTCAIRLRGPYDRARRAAAALDRGDVGSALKSVPLLAGPRLLDTHAVAREGVGALAETVSDGLVAPAFYYAAGGLPLLLAQRAARRLDRVLGSGDERHRVFGWASARLDDAFGFLPGRLAGLLIAVAAGFVPEGHPLGALGAIRRDARKHPSPGLGWPVAAVAGALGLALAAPSAGVPALRDPWIGNGRARAEPADLRRAAMLLAVAWLLALLAVGALIVVVHR